MRVLIYGGGAVGLGLGSCLLAAGEQVDVLARAGTVAALNREGLRRRGIFGDFHAPAGAFAAASALDQLPQGPYDYVLVCVKSFDSAFAAAELAARPGLLTSVGLLLLCQNGWGNADLFCRYFPPDRVFNARVITGFTRPAPNEVAVTVHADAVHAGSLFNASPLAAHALCGRLSAGGIPAETTPAIGRDLWAKMLYNCCLNPLGAILRVPYGQLGQSESTRYLMEQIACEVFQVMTGAGWQTHWPDVAGFLEAFYARQLPATAAHESSMLQDILAGRRTEIDALNGQVVALAAQQALPVPYNRTACELIRFQEQAGRGLLGR